MTARRAPLTADHTAAALAHHLATHDAMVLRATESSRRTGAIVDRLLPELPAVHTHPFPSNASFANGWAAIDRAIERKRLFRAIKPRMDRKIADRDAVLAAVGERRAA